jgi:hypothetical protein
LDGLPHQCGRDSGNAAARVGDETVSRGWTELDADVDPCAGFAEMVPGTGGLRRRWISKGSFPMIKASAMAAAAALVLLVSPIGSFAQSGGGASGGSAGGAASGPSAGTGSAAGSPNAGSAGAGTAGVSGVPSGPANAGGLNNSGNDPSGAGKAGKVVSQPPPGTNSLGTANSSGSSMTTGSAGSRAAGGAPAATGPQTNGDVAIDQEDKAIDRKLKSICRGC